MSLNWTMLTPERTPIPLPHELVIRTVNPPGADLTLSIPSAPPTGSTTSGGSGSEKKVTSSGGIWLTDQRLIFVSAATPSGSDFDSLSVPLTAILSTKFEQPFFGANYLTVEIKPTPGGGLTEGSKAEIRLKDKGLFEFTSSLEKTRERAIYMRRSSCDEEEGLPSYTSPAGPSLSTTPAPIPAPSDAPPAYDA